MLLQTKMCTLSHSILSFTSFKFKLKRALYFKMYMSRATKKYKLVSKVKPKAESWRHFKLYDIKLYCCFVENHDCAKNQIKRNIIAHLIILIDVDINIQLQPNILQLRIQFYISGWN